MAENIIDARGLSCPEPVVRAKKGLEEHDKFSILVDNETAKENVIRFCSNKKAKVDVVQDKDEWRINVSK